MNRPRSLLIALLCLAVVASPVGAHLHLCFDGQEPAASLHLIDDGMHHSGGLDKPHHDAEVDVDTQGLPKLAKSAIFSAAFLVAWLFVSPAPLVHVQRARARRTPRHRPRLFLRPLTRGPPR